MHSVGKIDLAQSHVWPVWRVSTVQCVWTWLI